MQQLQTSQPTFNTTNSTTTVTPMSGVAGQENNAEFHFDIENQKDCFVDPSPETLSTLERYIQTRVTQGHGEAILELGKGVDEESSGLTEAELAKSMETLSAIAITTQCTLSKLRSKLCSAASSACTGEGDVIVASSNGAAAESSRFQVDLLIRANVEDEQFMDIRVAVVGNVDAGKSTLLGVLTHGDLDNGRGLVRQKLFRHKHEVESGRTSSVGNDILGFDSAGQSVNRPMHGQLDWVRVCRAASKVITFIDLAGHERYLKTTVFGLTGHAPDFVMLMVGANAGIIGMTKEHLSLALALNVPVFVVVTKIDMCPANILQETMKHLVKILKSPGCRKMPIVVNDEHDVMDSAKNFISERICPIFCISNVTGHHIDLLRMFLNLLGSRSDPQEHSPAEFQIDETFQVPGVGTVISGTCLKGTIQLNDVLLLGPDPIGNFVSLPIRSIQRKRLPVHSVRGGQTASFAVKKVRRNQIRKGMMLISPQLNPASSWEFQADLLILHHPTTISVKYQAMVHVGPVRQTATITQMNRECLRTGDKAQVRFKFIKNPEYLHIGQRLVFREGKTKAVGTITQVFPHVAAVAQNLRNKNIKKATVAAAAAVAHSQLTAGNATAMAIAETDIAGDPDVVAMEDAAANHRT